MSINLTEVGWPVLVFGSPDCVVLRYESARQFLEVTYISINSIRNMREHFLVDADGKRFELAQPRPAVPLSSLRRAFMAITNRRLEIVYDKVEYAGLLSLDEIRALVKGNLSDYSDFWAAYDIDKMQRALDSAETIREVIELF